MSGRANPRRRPHGEIAHDIAMARLSLLCARRMAERAEQRLDALAAELAEASGPTPSPDRTAETGA